MIRVSSFIWIFLFSCFLTGCIERYYAEGDEFKAGTLVVIAHIDNFDHLQTIHISRSTNLEIPVRDPVSGCHVEIENGEGSAYEFLEEAPGEYQGLPLVHFLKAGEAYRLLIVTPEGKRYESEFETMYPAPAIDSVYWIREEHPGREPGNTQEGIQFYMNYEIEMDSGRYLRWQLEETYEFHNPAYEFKEIFDTDRTFKPVPAESDWNTCWIYNQLPDIYVKDLGNVEGEVYRAMPLNFVSNHSQRLKHRYSLLVRQFALSAEAYWYWEGLENNLQSNGGLFDSQPSLTPGNICNPDDADEIVIGYFSVSGATVKRVFVSDVPDLIIIEDPYFCVPGGLPYSFYRLSWEFLPYYLATLDAKYGSVDKKCIDCREYKSSSHIPPEFW